MANHVSFICPIVKDENLVKTNWNCDRLEKVVVIGNSLIQWVLKEYNPTAVPVDEVAGDDEEEDYEEGDDEEDGCEEGDDEEEEEDCDEGDDEDEEEEEDDEEGEAVEFNFNFENILKLSEDTEPPIKYIRAAKDYIQEFQIATFSETEFFAFYRTYWSFFKIGKDNELPHVDD